MRTCTRCGTRTDAACPRCVAAFPYRKPVELMTVEERAVEFESWVGILEIPFDMMHQRLEELAGRPVWTHELARPENIVAEILSGVHGNPFASLPPDKTIVVVVPAAGAASREPAQ